jgi:signal transduction histidine kinase
MTRHLGTRLLRGTCLLLLALLAATWLAGLYAAQAFANEFTQALNRSIGMYVADEGPLGADGAPDHSRLSQLAAQAMVLNPAAELYLLDGDGRVTWPAAPSRAAGVAVPLEPLRRLLADTGPRRAILGLDPLRPGSAAIFSVAALSHAGRPAGYVYVVVGGATYRGLIGAVAQSHILRVMSISIVALLLLAALAAWGLDRAISRPLLALHANASSHAQRLGIAGDAVAGPHPAGATDIEAVSRIIDGLVGRIEQQLLALENTDRARRELLTHVSHDLRTPLTAIRGYVETLLGESPDLPRERRRDFLSTIARHGERLQRLVDQVFLLSRLDAAVLPVRREPVSLAELVQDIAEKWRLSAEASGLRLTVRVDRRVRPVNADIGLIETVIENLLDNAFRHGRRPGSVEIEVLTSGAAVAVSVRNDGAGIDPAHDGRLHAVPSAGPGRRSGLGLAIVRRVLALHQGTFEIRALPEQAVLARFVLH